MIKFVHIQMIVRAWGRKQLSSAISLLSLSVGLLLSSILLVFVVKEFQVANSINSDGTLYVLEQNDTFVENGEARNKSISQIIPKMLEEKYPEIEAAMLFKERDGSWGELELDLSQPRVLEADSRVADLIKIPVLEGNLAKTLSSPNEVALTKSFALKLVSGNPIGQTVDYKTQEYTNEGQKEVVTSYIITTILEDPVNLPIRYSGFVGLDLKSVLSRFQYATTYGIVKFAKNANYEELVKKIPIDSAKFEDQGKRRMVKFDDMHFTPIDEVYFSPSTQKETFYAFRDKNILIIGLVVAMIILVIAVFNYINLTLVKAPQRIKNFSGQRIMGASKGCVRAQVVADTSFNILLAIGVVAIFLQPSLEVFNNFMESEITWQNFFDQQNLLLLFALIGCLIILPSLYIITKMEIGRPLDMFKNPNLGRAKVVRVMVVAQFAISVILVAVGMNIARQVKYITEPLPEVESMISLWADTQTPDKYSAVLEKINQNPNIIKYTVGTPFFTMKHSENSVVTLGNEIDSSFFDFYGIKILEGRNVGMLREDGVSNIVVNEAYVKSRGGDNIIGKEIDFNGEKWRIVGVCEDVMVENAKLTIQPIAYMPRRESSTYLNITVKTIGDVDERVKELTQIKEELFTEDTFFEVTKLSVRYEDINAEAVRMKRMVEFFTIVSLLLTAFGMFGISWYTVQSKANEIALRKIHGATSIQMVRMLCKMFFVWVAIASLIALPIAYILANRWLEQFAYRIENSIWVMLCTIVIIAIVTLLTVVWQTTKAAHANPVKSLKSE